MDLALVVPPGTWLGLGGRSTRALGYEAWTLGHSVVCTMSQSELCRWFEGQPGATCTALDQAAVAWSASLGLRALQTGPPTARVARFLLAPVVAFYEAEREARDLPRQVLARILQIRPETLSRALRALAEAEAIVVRPQLAIRDRDRLAVFGRA